MQTKKIKQHLAAWWQRFNKLGKWRFAILAFLLIVIGGSVWHWQSSQKDQSAQQIQTTTVEEGPIVVTLSTSGQVEQTNLSTITTSATGVVKKVYVTDGQEVKTGDKIAEMELDSTGQQNLSQAYASYLSAKNSLASAQNSLYTLESSMWKAHETYEAQALDTDLSVDDPIYIETNREWLAAEANYKNQQQTITQQQASLTNAWKSYQKYMAVITAPTSGVIKGINIAEGMVISGSSGSDDSGSSQTIATIGSDTKPIISVSVTEVDIGQIASGQKAIVTLDSLTDETFTGTVVSIDRVGSSTSGVTQYPVLIQLDSTSDKILPNMAATADIILASKQNALQVSSSAVTTQNGVSTVQVMQDGQSQTVTVETGLETDTMIEITSGLSAGDEVLTNTVGTSTTSTQSTRSNERGGFSGLGGLTGGRP